jgi:hypothetical protein
MQQHQQEIVRLQREKSREAEPIARLYADVNRGKSLGQSANCAVRGCALQRTQLISAGFTDPDQFLHGFSFLKSDPLGGEQPCGRFPITFVACRKPVLDRTDHRCWNGDESDLVKERTNVSGTATSSYDMVS